MTVFTRDHQVLRFGKTLNILLVTFFTIFRPLVFGRIILPLLLITQAVKPESITTVLRSKIVGNVEHPKDQDADHKADDHKERSPYMILHWESSLAKPKLIERRFQLSGNPSLRVNNYLNPSTFLH
jgi:hypothetical protein